MMILDGHVVLGGGRWTDCSAEALIRQMDDAGVDRALAAPADSYQAVRNEEGNALTTAASRLYPDRLLAYATVTPWLREGARAILERARDDGAVALALYPSVQGFDLLDGLVDDVVSLAAELRWPVYVRTGTPPYGLPLQLAEVARRQPHVPFIMGRSGATDFWLDVTPALRRAPNIYADTAYGYALTSLVDDPLIGAGRLVYTSDTPYSDLEVELAKTRTLVPATYRESVLGGTLSRLLGRG